MNKPVNKNVISKIKPEIESRLNKKGFDLFEIALKRESGEQILRITIDSRKGTGIDDCEKASRIISEYLDSDESLIPFNNYSLEVSTPGLLRPLKTAEDFERFKGRKCKITTKNKDESGRSSYTGFIKAATNGVLALFVEKENKTFNIEIENISKANLEIEF